MTLLFSVGAVNVKIIAAIDRLRIHSVILERNDGEFGKLAFEGKLQIAIQSLSSLEGVMGGVVWSSHVGS